MTGHKKVDLIYVIMNDSTNEIAKIFLDKNRALDFMKNANKYWNSIFQFKMKIYDTITGDKVFSNSIYPKIPGDIPLNSLV